MLMASSTSELSTASSSGIGTATIIPVFKFKLMCVSVTNKGTQHFNVHAGLNMMNPADASVSFLLILVG